MVEAFYKLAQSKSGVKPVKKKVKQVSQKEKPKQPAAQARANQKAAVPLKGTQVAKTPAQKIQEYKQNDAFPTPIGKLSTAQLYRHYQDMAKRINDVNLIDIFDPDKMVSEKQYNRNSPVHVCMVEGGEGVEAADGWFGLDYFPALVVRFCRSPLNPQINNMIGYTKSILDRSDILTSNYIIRKAKSARYKIQNSNYQDCVYVALDMDEDHEADE